VKRLVLLSVTALFVIGSAQGVANACQCQPEIDPAVEYAQVDAVFKGIVISITPASSPEWLDVLVAVTGYWKGAVVPLMHVYTGEFDGSCGYDFQVGLEYLIYAVDSVDECCEGVFTSICNRTRLLANAGEDLAFLGDPLPVPVERVTWGVVKAMYRD